MCEDRRLHKAQAVIAWALPLRGPVDDVTKLEDDAFIGDFGGFDVSAWHGHRIPPARVSEGEGVRPLAGGGGGPAVTKIVG